jgi:hypothetical protein
MSYSCSQRLLKIDLPILKSQSRWLSHIIACGLSLGECICECYQVSPLQCQLLWDGRRFLRCVTWIQRSWRAVVTRGRPDLGRSVTSFRSLCLRWHWKCAATSPWLKVPALASPVMADNDPSKTCQTCQTIFSRICLLDSVFSCWQGSVILVVNEQYLCTSTCLSNLKSPIAPCMWPSNNTLSFLYLEVVPSDGIGILPLICAWPPRGCTI